MNRLALIALSLAAAPVFAAPVPVATLARQQGTVMVNQGEVFATAADQQALQAGDRVMVMEGGHATLVFADGCELPLAAGSLLDVPAASPCAGQVAQVQSIGPSYAQAVGEGGTRASGHGWLYGVAGFATFYWLGKDGYSIKSPPTPLPVSP